jgi:hypothetical protein
VFHAVIVFCVIYMHVESYTQLYSRYYPTLIKKLYDLLKESRLSTVIRIARLRWACNVTRMDENCMPRRLMYLQPELLRKVRRPRAM